MHQSKTKKQTNKKKTLSNVEYLNLACSTTPGLYPKSSAIKYSYLSNSLDDLV